MSYFIALFVARWMSPGSAESVNNGQSYGQFRLNVEKSNKKNYKQNFSNSWVNCASCACNDTEIIIIVKELAKKFPENIKKYVIFYKMSKSLTKKFFWIFVSNILINYPSYAYNKPKIRWIGWNWPELWPKLVIVDEMSNRLIKKNLLQHQSIFQSPKIEKIEKKRKSEAGSPPNRELLKAFSENPCSLKTTAGHPLKTGCAWVHEAKRLVGSGTLLICTCVSMEYKIKLGAVVLALYPWNVALPRTIRAKEREPQKKVVSIVKKY